MKNYFETKSKSLAYALNFLGFSFYVFDDEKDNSKRYSFKVDEHFLQVLNKLNELKKYSQTFSENE